MKKTRMEKKQNKKSFASFLTTAQALVEKEIELAKQEGREKTQSFLLLCDIKYKLGKARSKIDKEKKYNEVKNISIH